MKTDTPLLVLTRQTHNFIELKTNQQDIALFKESDETDIANLIKHFEEVIEELKSYQKK